MHLPNTSTSFLLLSKNNILGIKGEKILISDGDDIGRIDVCDFSGMRLRICYFLLDRLNKEKAEFL